jgi:hypothetical protein
MYNYYENFAQPMLKTVEASFSCTVTKFRTKFFIEQSVCALYFNRLKSLALCK